MDILQIRNLTKSFKDMTAVNGLNLSIQKNDVHGILGPNGAGKSTSINCILGLLSYDSGSVKFENGTSIKKWGMNIGYVPQDLAIYPELSPLENIRFFCSLYGFKGKELEDRTNRALDFVGLVDVKNKKSGEFSGGMKRRLNLACGIAHSPKLIIMDEPTVGIDPQSRNRILENVHTLRKEGATIIYTTHYMPEIEEICNKITVIDHGKVIATGTKVEIMNKMGKDVETVIEFIEDNGNVAAFAKELDTISEVHKVKYEGVKCTVRYPEQCILMNHIIELSVKYNLAVKTIDNHQPSLEEIFLSLTGKELRDHK